MFADEFSAFIDRLDFLLLLAELDSCLAELLKKLAAKKRAISKPFGPLFMIGEISLTELSFLIA